MDWRMGVLAVALAVMNGVVRVSCDVENAVSLLSKYRQLVTSSTLRWVEERDGAALEHAVEGGADTLVCRTRANGMWVSGALRRGGDCTVSMHGRVFRHRDYQVLQNVENGGRLNWVRWDKFTAVGPGSVSAGGDPYLIYVARRSPGLLGKIDPAHGLLGKLLLVEADGAEHEYEEGEVLVETEPQRYEMDDVHLQIWRVRAHRDRLTLGAATLINSDPPSEGAVAGRVNTVIAYVQNTTVGWGHGHGILAGLPVSVRLANNTVMDEFKWATDTLSQGQATYNVEVHLPPGQACNVTLVGNWTESNVPYEARVTAVYADKERRPRTVAGVRREVGLRDVHPEFGPIYFLADGTLVPTTTTTTTSTSTTSTTTTTTTTTTSPHTPGAPPTTIKKRPAAAANNTDMQADGPGAMRDSASSTDNGSGARDSCSGAVLAALGMMSVAAVRGMRTT